MGRRTHKAGYRDRHHLWSRCFLDASGRPHRAKGAFQRFANTPEGVEALASFALEHEVTLVAMEATGGYEKKPFALLWAQGLPCAILNPRMVRRFAEAMGVLEKTDRIDAGVIAWCAQAKRVGPTEPASPPSTG